MKQTNLECAREIKRSWRYKAGLLAIRLRHPVATFGKRLDMNADHIAQLAGYGRMCHAAKVGPDVYLGELRDSDIGKAQRQEYGFDVLIWIALAQLIIQVAIWIWERWSDR